MTREQAIEIVKTQYPHDHVMKTALGLLIPELSESEDERIRKELIEFIKWSVDRHFMREDFHQAKRPSEWIAYLEKQKEFFKHGYGLYYYHNGGFTFVARPAEEEKQKEYHIPWYDYQKSKEAGYTIVPNEEYEQLIKQEEQNPAWSEEDEKMFASISNLLWEGYSCFREDKIPTPKWSKIRSWLKSLRPQPKQEWGEEDERIVGRIQMILEFFDRNYPADMNIGSEIPKYISWLKSLRPRPSWKPSQEQMSCLCAAVDAAIRKHNESASGYEPARVLKSLYEQLQKLM